MSEGLTSERSDGVGTDAIRPSAGDTSVGLRGDHNNGNRPKPKRMTGSLCQEIRERYCRGETLVWWEERAIRRDIPYLAGGMGSGVWRAWCQDSKNLELAKKSNWIARHPEWAEQKERRMATLQEAFAPLVACYRKYQEDPDLAQKNGMAAQYMPLLEVSPTPGIALQALNALRKIYGHDVVKVQVQDLDNPDKVLSDFRDLAEQLGAPAEARQLTSEEVVVREAGE